MLKKTLLFKKADRQLLVKCHGIKMEYATLQLGHLSTGSALGGKPTKRKKQKRYEGAEAKETIFTKLQYQGHSRTNNSL